MPLRIYPDQRILFIREPSGKAFALHGYGKHTQALLLSSPLLNHLLPCSLLRVQRGCYLWEGTLVEQVEPGQAVPTSDSGLARSKSCPRMK